METVLINATYVDVVYKGCEQAGRDHEQKGSCTSHPAWPESERLGHAQEGEGMSETGTGT